MRRILLSILSVSAFSAEIDPSVVAKALPFPTCLVVQVGPEDGSLAVALAKAGPTVVAAMAKDEAGATAIRQRLRAAGIHGQATVTSLDGGAIPLDDCLADVVVADPAAGATPVEALRVLRPGGVLLLREGAAWKAEVKPRPADVDNWGQYNHDASGDNYSRDAQVGPGRSLRWLSGPQSPTTAGTLICEDLSLTIDNPNAGGRLVMRNAFNGLTLWTRDDIYGGGTTTKYANILTRDRLYLLPGLPPGYGPLTPPKAMLVLDARSGRTIQALDEGITYPQRAELEAIADKDVRKKASEGARNRHACTQAVLSSDGGTLLQVAHGDAVALDAQSGKRRWSMRAAEGSMFLWPVIADGIAYLCEGTAATSFSYTHWPMIVVRRVRAVDLATGAERWAWTWPADRKGAALINLMATQGRVVMNLRYPANKEDVPKDGKMAASLCILDAAKGSEAYWTSSKPIGTDHGYGGHSGSRVLVTGDRLWFTTIGGVGGSARIGDPATILFPGYRHGRPVGCTTFRSSPNWIFGNLTAYPLDATSPDAPIQHSAAARNSCDIGSFPANGLLYLTSNHCFCYPYLPGYVAFDARPFQGADDSARLEKGGAVAASVDPKAPSGWPMMLRTPDRQNWTDDAVPAQLDTVWTATPAGEPPAPALAGMWLNHFFAQGMATGVSIADGVAVVAASHRQEVVAYDAATGSERWRTGLDGRIDSQPTIHRGLVLAGTCNGYVYALNRDTGALVWRFRAAPRNSRILVDGALESPWPVMGSVTADGDRLFVFAGRNSDADGGLWWWVLDAASGAPRGQGRVGQDGMQPTTNVYPQWNPVRLPFQSPAATNLPVLTDKHLLLPGASFARVADNLEPWSIPQTEKSEFGGWRARFEFGYLTPGNQGLINRGADGYKKAQYGLTSGRIYAIKGDDFVNLGATIKTEHRGGKGGDQIARLKRQAKVEQPMKDGKPANEYIGSTPVWQNDKRANADSVAMAVAGDAVLVANRNPVNLQVLNLADGVQRQAIALPSPVIANGISSADGRVYLSLENGTIMVLGRK